MVMNHFSVNIRKSDRVSHFGLAAMWQLVIGSLAISKTLPEIFLCQQLTATAQILSLACKPLANFVFSWFCLGFGFSVLYSLHSFLSFA